MNLGTVISANITGRGTEFIAKTEHDNAVEADRLRIEALEAELAAIKAANKTSKRASTKAAETPAEANADATQDAK